MMTRSGTNWFVMGLVDDVVRRHPLPDQRLDTSPLHTLLASTLFGRKTLIHESTYCIQAPFLRDMLQGERSFVLSLVRHGQARIVSGEFNLWDRIESNLRRGIYDRNKNPDAGEAIAILGREAAAIQAHSQRVGRAGGYAGLPKVDHSWALARALRGFDHFPGAAHAATEAQARASGHPAIRQAEWNRLMVRFDELLHERQRGESSAFHPPARTVFEDAARDVLAADPTSLKLRLAMCVANEYYHNTLAALMSDELGTPIGSITCFSGTFSAHGGIDDVADTPEPQPSEDVPSMLLDMDAVIAAFPEFAADFFRRDHPLGDARHRMLTLMACDELDSPGRQRLAAAMRDLERELAFAAGYRPPRNAHGQVQPPAGTPQSVSTLVTLLLGFGAFMGLHAMDKKGEQVLHGHASHDDGTHRLFRRREVLAGGLLLAGGHALEQASHVATHTVGTALDRLHYTEMGPRLLDRPCFSSLHIDADYARGLARHGLERPTTGRLGRRQLGLPPDETGGTA